jgi:hypothetical protein
MSEIETIEAPTSVKRLDRMRLGKAVCEYGNLLSNPEERVALIPLTEAEYENSIRAGAMQDVPDNLMAQEYRERIQTREIVFAAARNPSDLLEAKWASVEEMIEETESHDINHLFDIYLEMVDKSSPSAEGIPDEEFEAIKKVLQEIPMNELSGRQWYALKRFLGAILPLLLQGNSLGSISTSLSTWMKDDPEPAQSASRSIGNQ